MDQSSLTVTAVRHLIQGSCVVQSECEKRRTSAAHEFDSRFPAFLDSQQTKGLISHESWPVTLYLWAINLGKGARSLDRCRPYQSLLGPCVYS